jgi:hypothetical protein
MSKYSIASKEARETHYWLRLLASNEIVPEADVQDLLEECNQLNIEGLARLWKPFQRQVMRTGKRNAVSYADRSNCC